MDAIVLARRRKAAVCRDWACESTDSPRTGAKKLKMLFPALTHAASPIPASQIQHDSGTSPNVGLDGTWQGTGNGFRVQCIDFQKLFRPEGGRQAGSLTGTFRAGPAK